MPDPATEELLRLNQRLLEAIDRADWKTYEELCDPSLTAFEPEGIGRLVEGFDFHRFYFNLGGVKGHYQTTMSAPHVRVMDDMAVVAYVRLHQKRDADGAPVTTGSEETRVWHRQEGRWRMVHFHRSPLPSSK
jgi:ketosteroid isomerase-like protein